MRNFQPLFRFFKNRTEGQKNFLKDLAQGVGEKMLYKAIDKVNEKEVEQIQRPFTINKRK